CTDDACNNGSCLHANNTTPCDDGVACTFGDACHGGTCSGTLVSCDDANPCTDDACAPRGCGSGDNRAGRADHNAGTASDTRAGGDACDGGAPSACGAAGDACGGGACHGAAIDCDDHDPCTDDSCGPSGCVHAPNAASCDDHDACTGGDVCAGGVCAGAALSC